jgi:hypothetical protein
MNVSEEKLSGKIIIPLLTFVSYSNFEIVSLLDLKSRLRKICGEKMKKGSDDVEKLKDILQQYPQLVNEVRFNGFSLACYFHLSYFCFLLLLFLCFLQFIGY